MTKSEAERVILWRQMMKGKKYLSRKGLSERNEPKVKEEGGRYARQISYKASLSMGINLTQAKKRLSRPVKRSAKEIEWALGIVGIGEGPEDLSENMRAYLRREK